MVRFHEIFFSSITEKYEIKIAWRLHTHVWNNYLLYLVPKNQLLSVYSLVILLISNLTFALVLGTKTTKANKSLKTDANGAHEKDY